MTWYQELGYKKNPLETDPFKANPELISYRKEAEELLYRIKAGSMVLIEGPEGSGKTLLLKQAINNFKGNNKVIYLDGKQTSKRIDIERVLNKRQSLTKRLLGRKPRNLILLMDDVQHLTRKNNERIKYYYDQNYLQSVAFTTTNKRIIPKSIKGRIGKRIIKLRKPTPEDAIKITINRL